MDEDALRLAKTTTPPPSAKMNNSNDDGNDGRREEQSSLSSAPPPPPHTHHNNDINDKLNRELALSKKHRLELQSQWRHILSHEKFNELQQHEIPTLIQHHNENITRKTQVIHSLENEIQTLQQLYQDAMVANMNRMEDLIELHNETCVKLNGDFHTKLTTLQSTFQFDIAKINEQYQSEKMAVQQCIDRQAIKDAEQLQSLRADHQHELEEMTNRNLERINSLRFIMNSKVEELEEQFEQTKCEYAQNTDGTIVAYEQLKSKDEMIRADIASKTKHANKIQREIQRFQLMSRQEQARINDRHVELLARKVRAISRWNSMQEQMTKYRNVQNKRLVTLIKRANECKDELKRQCLHAERVTKIALSCQRYESSREKFASILRESSCPPAPMEEENRGEDRGGNDGSIVSKGDSVGNVNNINSNKEEEGDDYDDDEQQKQQQSFIIGCMGRLGDTTNHFWNKYNMTKLDVLCLEKKVRRLQKRQEELQMKLKSYHDGITVNDNVLKDRNPLFVINGKMNMPNHMNKMNGHGGKSNKKTMMRKRLTVVDGNLAAINHNTMTQVS